jgi:tetratricopeptide (TPR) repeat protein
MLLRQLSLGYYAARRFDQAETVALQAVDLRVLPDVVLQDAARAALGAGDLDAAVAHLRIASRRGPASRRSFHRWTLGSILCLAGRYAESEHALERALRWATTDRPLYRAHLALVRTAAGRSPKDLGATMKKLAALPAGRGYGRFILGHLSYAAGAWSSARRLLRAFISRIERSGPVLSLALEGELRLSRATLAKMAPPS